MNDKIIELLELGIMDDEGKVTFTNESENLIYEIAKECRNLPIYQANKEKVKGYAEGMTAEEVFVDMLYKIAEAPIRLYAAAAAKMLIPVIDDKLKPGRFRKINCDDCQRNQCQGVCLNCHICYRAEYAEEGFEDFYVKGTGEKDCIEF